ncbi:hypothetical protein ARAM_003489 [Aspergillus rambellii]|uniref:Cyclase n=1 Tax=Aspergillus rambellii TaxID=308745 RepID=A0A0F8V933_9EURO|nr:hypothetical protein ARAM_003489 [Aspergillus rambellii]
MSSHQQLPLTAPWNPDSDSFPRRKDLPKIEGAPDGAAWFWGEDDNLGRLNLLTPRRVRDASSEIKTGEVVPLNLPLNMPQPATFHREDFVHSIKSLTEDVIFDDTYTLNTQSSTQWDGFRHFAHMPSKVFYNGTTGQDIVGPHANHKCSIHHWATHGIAGRGILLDYRRYAKSKGINYDPCSGHAISYKDLHECGRAQGIDIRPWAQGGDIKIGDILLVRSGFVERYQATTSQEERAKLIAQTEAPSLYDMRFAGLQQEEPMVDWLHDCYFAGVAGDSPSFERWPTPQEYYLHEFILALWGMPLGEMWDLDRLAAKCAERERWTFFMTSAPANVPGGISTHANAIAIL